MAKGRMLNKKISLDDKVNRLSCDTSRLLFTWIISHLDQAGCFYGEPDVVKNLVFPLRTDVKISKIAGFLNEFEQLGLIITYKVDGVSYIFLPKFIANQPGLRPDREAKSDIPPYKNDGVNPSNCRSNDGVNPDLVRPNRTEEKYKRTEVEEEVEKKRKEDEVLESGSSGFYEDTLPEEDIAEVTQAFEENVCKITNGVSIELKYAFQHYRKSDLLDAIRVCALQNKHSMAYFLGVLRNKNGSVRDGPGKKYQIDPDKYIKGKYGHMVHR